MEDLSQHILDVVENSLRHKARLIEISLEEDVEQDRLTLQIRDDGNGLDPQACARAADPFFTTRAGCRVGLGLPLLAQAAKEADGQFDIASSPGAGTTVRATFRRSHPDCKPLGDMFATLQLLVVAHPEVGFVYEHRRGAETVRLDTREVRQP